MVVEINYEEMGKRIREKREEKKLTQQKLAEKVDISPSYFGQVERGENKCSLAVIVKIAIVLELNLDTLIRGINEKNAGTALMEILKNVPAQDKQLFVEICEEIALKFQKKYANCR